MKFFIMALKNVLRAKGRSLMTLSILSLGILIFIFYGTFIEGFVNTSINGMIDEDLGHIRIRTLNYDEDFPFSETNMWYISSEPLNAIDNITYTPRLLVSAELDNYEDTLPVTLIGIDPQKDSNVFTITTTSAEPLEDTAWIGAKIARDMDVSEGDFINITFRNPSGAFISGEYEIGGLLNSGNPSFSEQGVIVDISELQELMGTNVISHYSIRLENIKQLDTIAQQIQILFPFQEVLTWEDLTGDLKALMAQNDVMLGFFYFIIVLIAFLGLLNSILISVWEKRKNIGTLRAIGFYDKEIIQLFLYEGLWIGIIGSVIGVILGVLVNIPLTTIGINYGVLTQMGDGSSVDLGIYLPPIIRSTWNPLFFITPLIVVPFSSMLISYIPAKKSITMSIVDCIRNKD